MALSESKRKSIIEYLTKNPIERGKPNCYGDVASAFRVLPEQVRRIHRTLREKGLIKGDVSINKSTERQFQEDVKSGTGNVTTFSKRKVSTLKELISVCDINLDEWNIDRWICNQWQVGAKNNANKIEVTPLFQVKAWLSRRKVETDLVKQKEAILAELKAYAPKYDKRINIVEKYKNTKKECLCEISLADHHFSKLSWRSESGEDYDIKIAEKRWKEAIKSLLSRANINQVEKFLLPIGNDLFHIDNRNNTTTAGTFVDSDMRFFKMVKIVRRILVETIDDLLSVAPVDILIIPGNHDYHASLWIGEVLEAYYHNNQQVSIDSSPTTRKYYKYGKVGFQLSHGNEESVKDLGLIFAAEQKHLWADTDFHYCQLGHTHKSKKIDYISEDEYQGFQVQVMPSLCGTDSFHFKKGYISNKAAKLFMYHKEEGKIAEFTYTHREE